MSSVQVKWKEVMSADKEPILKLKTHHRQLILAEETVRRTNYQVRNEIHGYLFIGEETFRSNNIPGTFFNNFSCYFN